MYGAYNNSVGARQMRKVDQPRRKIARSALMMTTAAAALVFWHAPALAQTDTTIVDGQTTTVANPGGGTVTAPAGVTQTVDNGSNIDLENNTNDDSTIIVDGTLINNDTDDEDVVIFIDNGEDDVVVTIGATGVLEGVNGVIFAEGDAVNITNDGTITGTGVAEEGVIYIDRDADGALNTITNNGTITSVGGPAIGLDSLLGTAPGSSATGGATPAAPNVFGGTLNVLLTNTGTIENTGTAGGTNAIFFNGDPGNTSEGSIGGSSANPRGCFENIDGAATPQINCQFGITINNSGTISSTNGEAIRNDDDAVLNGTLTNRGQSRVERMRS